MRQGRRRRTDGLLVCTDAINFRNDAKD